MIQGRTPSSPPHRNKRGVILHKGKNIYKPPDLPSHRRSHDRPRNRYYDSDELAWTLKSKVRGG